jgi:hypothetical protein
MILASTTTEMTKLGAGLIALLLIGAGGAAGKAADIGPRRPAALALVDGGRVLLVACRASGSVAAIAAAQARLLGEAAIGAAIADVAAVAQTRYGLAVDEAAHELILLDAGGVTPRAADRAKVSAYPVSVRVFADGARAAVASRWSRRVSMVRLSLGGDAPRLEVERAIDLPFAARAQALFDGERRLAVADAFGARLGFIDLAAGTLAGVEDIDAHRIGALALSPDGATLAIACQKIVNFDGVGRDAPAGFEVVNRVILAAIAPPGGAGPALRMPEGAVRALDAGAAGAADPEALAYLPSGDLVAALGGAGALAAVAKDLRVEAGRRPAAIAVDAAGGRIFVADFLDDAVVVIDGFDKPPEARRSQRIALAPPREETLSDRGEALFYDARLSGDRRMSCHSCHVDGHASPALADTRGDGTFGTPKRILHLGGVSDTGTWAWNGREIYIDNQIRTTVRSTMKGGELTDSELNALSHFIRSVPIAPSLSRARGTLDEAAARRGEAIFEAQGCPRCHEPPEYTSAGTFDVGFRDEAGLKRFNPPSLRGVSQRDRLLHDGRAASIEELVGKLGHRLKTEVTEEELRDLMEFLRSL